MVRLDGEMLSLSQCERAFGVRERESIAVLIDDEEHVALGYAAASFSIAAHRPTRLRRCFNSLTQRDRPLHSTLGYLQVHADLGAFIVGELNTGLFKGFLYL